MLKNETNRSIYLKLIDDIEFKFQSHAVYIFLQKKISFHAN